MAKKIVQPVEVQASVKGDESVKSFRAQLREAQQDALRLAEAFGETDARTLAAAGKVAQLRDRMDDLNATIAGLHPDRFEAVANITGTLANGFAAAQGAAALLGGESEDLQKAMLRVQGAMAFAQGIAGLKDIKLQFASLGSIVTGTVLPALQAMRAALGTAGLIGVVVAVGAAIAYVVTNFKELTGQLSDMERAQARVRDTMREATGKVEEQRLQVEFYRRIINDTTKSEDERRAALDKLKELVPTLTDNEINNANALAKTNTELNDYIKNAILRAQIDALIAKRAENNNKISEATAQGLEKSATFADKATAAFKAFATGMSYDAFTQMEAANSLGKSINDLTLENAQLDKQLEDLESQYIKTEVTQAKYKSETEKTTGKVKEQSKEVKKTTEEQANMNRKGAKTAEEAAAAFIALEDKKNEVRQKAFIDTKNLQKDVDEWEEKNAEESIERQKALNQNKLDLAVGATQSMFELVNALTTNNNAKTEAERKREFQRAKAFQIAQTMVSTFAAAQQAYQSQMQFTPDSPIRAAIAAATAVASGLARVAAIKKQQYTPGGQGSPAPSSPGGGGIQRPSLPASSTLGGGSQMAGEWNTRVFVTEGDITGTQRRVNMLRGASVI
jgi:chromosome segregation ATPase